MGKIFDLFKAMLQGKSNLDAVSTQGIRRQQNYNEVLRRRKQEQQTIHKLRKRQERLEWLLGERQPVQKSPRIASIEIDDILGFPTEKWTKKKRKSR